MHLSVGAIIKKDDKYLLVDRKKFPPGWACPAGHVDEGETPEQAMIREVEEETGLTVKKYKLILHEYSAENICSRGVKGHDFFVYEITAWQGGVRLNKEEHLNISWFTAEEMKKLKLEPVWHDWLLKLHII